MGESTEIARSPSGHRLRRAAARSALVLGFAVGGWLAVTGSASADTAPPSPPTPAPLFVDAGSLLGSLSAPLTPSVAAVATPVTAVVAPVTAVVASVNAVVAPVTAVVAPVVPQVETLVAPALRTLSPVLAPVTGNVAPLAAVLRPAPAPLTSSPALNLTTDGPSAVGQGPSAVIDSTPAQPASGAGASPDALALSFVAGPSGSESAALNALTDGPVVPLSTAPASPVGAPGSGTGNSSATGVGQLLAVVADPAALHLRTRSSLAASSDDLTLLALASEPGFSPA